MSCLAFILTFAPKLVEKKYKIEIPLDFEIVIILFIFASLFLGEIHNFYLRFWWWDTLLHTVSAFAFACVGFVILLLLFKTNKIVSQPVWIVIFSFCFAVTIGVLWEIFEFFMDQTFSFNMQKTGLLDTMLDLISNSIGALAASLAGYAYLKSGQHSLTARLINSLITSNPKIKFKPPIKK